MLDNVQYRLVVYLVPGNIIRHFTHGKPQWPSGASERAETLAKFGCYHTAKTKNYFFPPCQIQRIEFIPCP